MQFPVNERGTMKYVVEYFTEIYGFVIQHTQCPHLEVGYQQRPNCLPMEEMFCLNPARRISALDALAHAYFKNDDDDDDATSRRRRRR
ncbi:unnamed protein product [Camellia sinensis]